MLGRGPKEDWGLWEPPATADGDAPGCEDATTPISIRRDKRARAPIRKVERVGMGTRTPVADAPALSQKVRAWRRGRKKSNKHGGSLENRGCPRGEDQVQRPRDADATLPGVALVRGGLDWFTRSTARGDILDLPVQIALRSDVAHDVLPSLGGQGIFSPPRLLGRERTFKHGQESAQGRIVALVDSLDSLLDDGVPKGLAGKIPLAAEYGIVDPPPAEYRPRDIAIAEGDSNGATACKELENELLPAAPTAFLRWAGHLVFPWTDTVCCAAARLQLGRYY